MKNGGRDKGSVNMRKIGDDDVSDVSSISDKSFVNHNDDILKKLRDLQFENENVKLEVNAKLKIIEKLKGDLKDQDQLKVQL